MKNETGKRGGRYRHGSGGDGLERLQSSFKGRELAYIASIIIIAALGLWLRSTPLQFQGLYEPDGFFYYAAIKQTIANHFIFSPTMNLSGYPGALNPFNEAPGLIYFVVIPYLVLGPIGVSALTIMRLIPLLFAILTGIGVYLLSARLVNSKVLGILAAFFIATSVANMSKTSATIYRGDTFISVFVILALIFLLKTVTAEKRGKQYAYAIATIVLASIGDIVWDGGYLVFMVCLTTALLCAVYSFISGNRKLLDRSIFLLVCLFFSLALGQLYFNVGIVTDSNLTLSGAAPFYLLLVVGALVARLLITDRRATAVLKSAASRAILVAACLVLAGAFLYVLLNTTIAQGGPLQSIVATLRSSQNIVRGATTISNTTQEDSAPSLGFLGSAFGIQLLLAPLGILAFILLRPGVSMFNAKKSDIGSCACFAAVLAYLLITSYLQANEVRYEAVLSVPVAILSAYCVYAVGMHIKDKNYTIGLPNGTKSKLLYTYLGVVSAIFILQVGLAATAALSNTQGDGITPQFLQAMTWLSNNTASNATVLTLWDDGSVVEGWGDRMSLMDSVGGENAGRIGAFADFLANASPDTQYLYSGAHMPDYLITRTYWLSEFQGIFEESNTTILENSTPAYGFVRMLEIGSSSNSGSESYQFSNPIDGINMTLDVPDNGTTEATAAIYLAGKGIEGRPSSIIFDNISSENITDTALGQNESEGYAVIVYYYGSAIVGAVLVGTQMQDSNLFKILLWCGQDYCAYDNSNVTIQLVYRNPDTSIFKINYIGGQQNQSS